MDAVTCSISRLELRKNIVGTHDTITETFTMSKIIARAIIETIAVLAICAFFMAGIWYCI